MGCNETNISRKYKYYYIQHDIKEYIFKMSQKGDENLEYFVEIFVYNVVELLGPEPGS